MGYLHFNELNVAHAKKTRVWEVTSMASDSILGKVSFRGAWRKYVFVPWQETVFDAACLREIADFTEEQTKVWRGGVTCPPLKEQEAEKEKQR